MVDLERMDGVIVVDKPQGWTSHDVVGKMRRLAGTKRVGHLGTLDPMATGVLPIVINKATRLSQFYLKADKVYEAVVVLGQATNSYDADGEPVGEVCPCALSLAQIEEQLDKFRGVLEQMPPAVSAKKINGVPAYKLARQNKPVVLQAVQVTVHRLEVLAYCDGRLRIIVDCTAGTYVRSIAHDLGQAIGCGAHLAELRRTRSGCFDLAQAHSLEALAVLSGEGRLAEVLQRNRDLLPEMPCERVDDITAAQIRNGRDFHTSPFHGQHGSKYVKAVTADGEVLAIGEARMPNLYHPMLVL